MVWLWRNKDGEYFPSKPKGKAPTGRPDASPGQVRPKRMQPWVPNRRPYIGRVFALCTELTQIRPK